MTIEDNFYPLMSTSEGHLQTVDFVLNLEVLNGCVHSCPGCFVNRRNPRELDDLNVAVELAQQAHEKGLRFRELVLSPTDIFSSINTIELLRDERFQRLMRINPITRITTTAMFEGLKEENLRAVFNELDNEEQFPREMILEFLIPLNAPKILSRDPEYLAEARRFIDFLKHETPKKVDWSFVVNVGMDKVLQENFDELTAIVRDDFDTIIEFLPSFFRTAKESLISAKLDEWRQFLRSVIHEGNYDKVMFSSACKSHNGYNVVVVNFKAGKLFVSPFVYEQIMLVHPALEIAAPTMDSVDATVVRLAGSQYQYATKCQKCGDCPMLPTCVGRNVLSFMEAFGQTECPFPHDVLMKYYA